MNIHVPALQLRIPSIQGEHTCFATYHILFTVNTFYHILLGHGLPTIKSDVGIVSNESLMKHTSRYQCNTLDKKSHSKLCSKTVAVAVTLHIIGATKLL